MSQARLPPLAVLLPAMGMEMSYLYLGLLLVSEHLGLYYLTFALILLLYLLSPAIELIAAGFPGARRTQPLTGRLSVALVGAILVLAIWQVLTAGYPAAGVLAVLGFCGLAWWLGNTLFRGAGYYHILFRFQIGILFLLIFAGADTLLPVVLFYGLAVFALSRARWENTLAGSRGVLQTFSFWRIVLASAAFLVPAALIFLIVSPEIAGDILHGVTGGYGSFVKWFTDVMSWDFWHKQLVTIDWQPSCISRAPVSPTPSPTPAPPVKTMTVPPIVTWMFFLAVFLAGLVFITRAIRKLRTQRKAQPVSMVSFEVKSIRVNIFGELLTLLYGVLKWLWRGLLSPLRRVKTSRFRSKPDEIVTSVRVIYRELLRWAERQAVPRDQSQTAIEYLKVLCQKFPQETEALALITGVYLEARYSCRPISSQEFETAKEAWQKIRLVS